MKNTILILSVICSFLLVAGCETYQASSDQKQSEQQERILQEGTSQVGMPAIKNFRERKIVKQLLEMRDQSNLVTYSYVENTIPTVVRGYTALGGKFTYLGVTIGYGTTYATQFTSPQKVVYVRSTSTYSQVLPQADPNGLFSPASAEGTWIMMKDPDGNVTPQYIEPKIATFTYKLPMD